jgi:zinc resistance-associated protein
MEGKSKTQMKKEDSRMKKLAVVLGSIMLIAAIAYPVFAQGPRWGWGHHMKGDWGGGPGSCWDYERGHGTLTPEKRTQLDNLNKTFYDETTNLRNELWTKSGELGTFLNAPNPDAEKVRALQREISGLRAKLGEKRLDYELEARKIAPEGTYARGYGRHYGRHMRGYGPHMGGHGPGSCWN